MVPVDLSTALRAGATELESPLDDAQAQALLAYLAQLIKWSDVYNLTAVRDPRQILTQHLLDSLSVVAPLRRLIGDKPTRLLDVGSGAGLPGIVLAVAMPNVEVTCVDAVAKKAAFMRQAAAELGLRNLQARHARVEALCEASFGVIASRAFSSLAELVRLTRSLLAPDGTWLAMKGKVPASEIGALPDCVHVFHVEPVTVPKLRAQRCLVWMKMQSAGQKASPAHS